MTILTDQLLRETIGVGLVRGRAKGKAGKEL